MKKKILFRLFLVIFIISVGLLINTYYKSYKADKLYDEAREMYYKNIEDVLNKKISSEEEKDIENSEETNSLEELVEEQVEEEATENPSEEPREENAQEEVVQQEPQQEENQISKEDIDFEENVIGWINIDGTRIDYPVVQTDNNDFYLNHNYKGERDSYGSIYMDFRNVSVERDDNIIIYGHKIRDGSMFSDLANYTNEGIYKDYFENNDTITLDHKGERTTWEIYSAYVVNLDSEDYYLYTIFKDREKYKGFIEESKERSLVKKDIEITEDDTVISLVTCNFWYDNARVIIHGKLIK